MKKIFILPIIAILCFTFVAPVTSFAKTNNQSNFARHSMAARQRQAAQRDRIVNQRKYALEKQARQWQKNRNPFAEIFSHKKQEKKFEGERVVNAPMFAERVLALCNAERAKVGVSPMYLAKDLQRAANVRAGEIVQVTSHTRPDGSSCFSIVEQNNNTLGENIAAGSATPDAVVEQWMNSDGHRANILNPIFKELGVGYTQNDNSLYKYYWIQIFRG